MHLRVGLVGLNLGEDVRGSARYDHDLDVIGLSKAGSTLSAYTRSMVPPFMPRYSVGGGMGRAGEQGEGQAGQRET